MADLCKKKQFYYHDGLFILKSSHLVFETISLFGISRLLDTNKKTILELFHTHQIVFNVFLWKQFWAFFLKKSEHNINYFSLQHHYAQIKSCDASANYHIRMFVLSFFCDTSQHKQHLANSKMLSFHMHIVNVGWVEIKTNINANLHANIEKQNDFHNFCFSVFYFII